MRRFLLSAAMLFSGGLMVGCGSGDASAPDPDELGRYIDENPDKIAAQEEIDDKEDGDDD